MSRRSRMGNGPGNNDRFGIGDMPQGMPQRDVVPQVDLHTPFVNRVLSGLCKKLLSKDDIKQLSDEIGSGMKENFAKASGQVKVQMMSDPNASNFVLSGDFDRWVKGANDFIDSMVQTVFGDDRGVIEAD